MNTKQKILKKALELFNSDGVKEVTLRRIASSLEISQGNLNYHFKTKNNIISALYFELVSKLDTEMSKILVEQPIISFLYESSLVSMNIMYHYRFITKDLYKVLQADEKLKRHYMELQKLRKSQYDYLFQKMVHEELLREEELHEEYSRLYQRMNILGDNWVYAADLASSSHQSNVKYYHALLFEVIYPYLTEKGKKQFHELLDK